MRTKLTVDRADRGSVDVVVTADATATIADVVRTLLAADPAGAVASGASMTLETVAPATAVGRVLEDERTKARCLIGRKAEACAAEGGVEVAVRVAAAELLRDGAAVAVRAQAEQGRNVLALRRRDDPDRALDAEAPHGVRDRHARGRSLRAEVGERERAARDEHRVRTGERLRP